MEKVRVALIGDRSVGKTSLVLAAADKPARGEAPTPTLPPTRLHVQWLASEATCICQDTDTEEVEEIRATLRKSDVVLICFAMDVPATMKSALTKWLPLALSANKQLPILFIGCKKDISKTTDADLAVRHASDALHFRSLPPARHRRVRSSR
jgi:GTPase SAR1 family protein